MKTDFKKHINLSVSEDTAERLKQFAWERHTSVSQAVTDWIWGEHIKNQQIRGQMSIDSQ